MPNDYTYVRTGMRKYFLMYETEQKWLSLWNIMHDKIYTIPPFNVVTCILRARLSHPIQKVCTIKFICSILTLQRVTYNDKCPNSILSYICWLWASILFYICWLWATQSGRNVENEDRTLNYLQFWSVTNQSNIECGHSTIHKHYTEWS